MRKAGRGHLAGGDDDPRAHLGPVPHLHGKGHGHADAAMRGRIARQHAGMHGDAGPGDPLHIGHRRAAIDVGMMQLLFLDDAEHAHRRRMALHARGDRRFREEAVGVVDPQLLLVDRDRDDQRSLRLGRLPFPAPRSSWPDGGGPCGCGCGIAGPGREYPGSESVQYRARLPPGRRRRSRRPPSGRQSAKACPATAAPIPAHACHSRIPQPSLLV